MQLTKIVWWPKWLVEWCVLQKEGSVKWQYEVEGADDNFTQQKVWGSYNVGTEG